MKIKVTTSLYITNSDLAKEKLPNPVFTDEFRNRIWGAEEYFRSQIILKINEIAGNGWSVEFIQVEYLKNTFLVDLYLDNPDLLHPIREIIVKAFPEKKFLYFFCNKSFR